MNYYNLQMIIFASAKNQKNNILDQCVSLNMYLYRSNDYTVYLQFQSVSYRFLCLLKKILDKDLQ